jgi:hypothetical protein
LCFSCSVSTRTGTELARALVFYTLDLFSVIAGLDCHRVATVTCGATGTTASFPSLSLSSVSARSVLVHWFDQTVTRDTAFEFGPSRLGVWLLRLIGSECLNHSRLVELKIVR